MENREHDIMLDMLANPNMTLGQLESIGMNALSTSLQDRQKYADNSQIQSKFLDSNGNFDPVKYNKFYDDALLYYNAMANKAYNEQVLNQITYHRDNIFVPREKRRSGPDYTEVNVSNPYQITQSVIELGTVGKQQKSVDELALANKVLLNPTTAGDNLENAQWGDTPNDNFTGYFLDTLVLAQYDSDGTHINPITKKTELHSKGDLKLDDTGNFYYEKLDGRDIYERRVLNKMNVLTVDGSFANKFDFFDSDDMTQKSLGGSILKNAALVGSMFIPYVGPWIAGASVLTLLVGLYGTVGKMISGSDSPMLSELEGWSKSMSRQGAVTEEAAQNPWAMENWINLIGDVAGQLKELRFIFEKLPMVFKGADAMSEAGQAKKLKELVDAEKKLLNTKISELGEGATVLNLKNVLESGTIALLKAEQGLRSWVKGYNTIGEIASKGYMTLITTADTYGEAKAAGASDLDATLLTLGHMMGEYAILNTGLGEWVLPELRAGRVRSEAIANALIELEKEGKEAAADVLKLAAKEGKKAYMKKAFEIGKKIAKAEYATGKRSLTASGAAALGEGFEEVSEEFLADFSKGCYDVVKWLQGDNTRVNSFGYDFDAGEWNSSDVLTRYGMSAIGGFIGGGLTNAGTNYKMLKSFDKMTSDLAVQQLVSMARNGEMKDFLRDIDKMNLGKRHLSTKVSEINGNLTFDVGTEQDNQDAFAKRAIKKQAQIIQGIIDANGASVSDDSLLRGQTELLKDLRFNILHKTSTAGAFIKEFNRLTSEVVKTTNSINQILDSALDTNEDGVVTDREQRRSKLDTEQQLQLKSLEDKLKEDLKNLKDMIDGKRSYQFIADSLFDATTTLSRNFTFPTFTLYAEHKEGRKYSEIPEQRLETLRQEYKNWSESDRAEQIHLLSTIYRKMAELSSSVIKNHADSYLQVDPNLSRIHQAFQSIYNILNVLDNDYWIAQAQNIVDSPVHSNIFNLFASEEDRQQLMDIKNRAIPEDAPNRNDLIKQLEEEFADKWNSVLLGNVDKYIQPFIDRGFANVETKILLNNILEIVKDYLNVLDRDWKKLARKNMPQSGLGGLRQKLPPSPYLNIIEEIKEKSKQVKELNNTPFEENLNQFAISVGKDPINITELVEKLSNALTDVQDNITNYRLGKDLHLTLKNAILTMKMYKAAILGARTDSLGLEDAFGYNATLNQVAKKVDNKLPELAEIDSKAADVFIEDINNNLAKLEFLENLYSINLGNKLGLQDAVSQHKDILVYKEMRKIINIPDDDPLKQWKDFDKLKQAIRDMTLHSELADNPRALSEEERIKFQKEAISLENAIYDFFNVQENVFTNISKLKEFVNCKHFNFFTDSGKLMNESLDSLDDNSLLWWIAGRAALKAQDFYNEYKQIIGSEGLLLAPIPTQELAIYNNYANIVNGTVFEAFALAFKESMIENWNLLSSDKRKTMLRLTGEYDETNPDDKATIEALSSDDYADEAINFLPIPRYSNIVLTEGIPGSGNIKFFITWFDF